MNKYTFNIIVETDKVLNNKEKGEIMEAIKINTGRIQKTAGYVLDGATLRITREVTPNDVMESLRGTPTKDSVSRDNCWYYDEAQGRHHCTNDLVKCIKCEGVCNYYRDKRE